MEFLQHPRITRVLGDLITLLRFLISLFCRSNHPLSMQSGFDQNYCYGDVLLSFVWSGSSISSPVSMKSSTENMKKMKLISISKGSTDKGDEDKTDSSADSKPPSGGQSMQPHDFIRTHFHRTTQCDYCGKKIWLKDAVQCRDCAMCCHKKCINKCQSSTVCTVSDVVQPASASGPEFRVTEAESPTIEVDDFVDIVEEQQQAKSRLESHRQSFSDLLAQGLKRVNSANNLSIPMVSALNQSSKSLPPTPQHTPRKQSLANVNANPFAIVAQKLEGLPEDIKELQMDQIVDLTAPLIEYGSSDTLMALAKSTSKSIYADLEPDERTERINKLVSVPPIGVVLAPRVSATVSHVGFFGNLFPAFQAAHSIGLRNAQSVIVERCKRSGDKR